MFIFLITLIIQTYSELLLKNNFEGQCQNTQQSPQLSIQVSKSTQYIALWLKLYNPSSGINQQSLNSFQRSRIIAILQLSSQSGTLNLLMNSSQVITQKTNESAIISNITINYLDWNFIRLSPTGGTIWNTDSTQAFQMSALRMANNLQLILGSASLSLNDSIAIGLCGVIRMVSFSSQVIQPFDGPGQLQFQVSSVSSETLFKSQIDNLIHINEPQQRNVTVLDGVIRVRGAIPYSLYDIIQATISFYVYFNQSTQSTINIFRHFRAHYQQIGIKAIQQGQQYVLQSCYQESKDVECQFHLNLKISIKQWVQVIARVYEQSIGGQQIQATFELTIINNNNQVTTQSQSYDIMQNLKFQAGDNILIGSNQVKISKFQVFNTIDVDTNDQTCMPINVEGGKQCLISPLTQQQITCRPNCKTCYSYDVCLSCAGNRINPPDCDCPSGTYFNDIKETCEQSLKSDMIQTGIFDLNKEFPNHILRYTCSREIQCSNIKQLSTEITFDWPFPSYVSSDKTRYELAISVVGYRFLTNFVDFNIQENYLHLGAFKITIQVDPQAQLEQLVLSWVVFIPQNSLYQSFIRTTDQYIFSDSIQKARSDAQSKGSLIATYTIKYPTSVYFQGTQAGQSENKTLSIIMLNQISKCRNCFTVINNTYNMFIKPSIVLKDDGNFQFSVQYSSSLNPELMKFTILLVNQSLMNVQFVSLKSTDSMLMKSDNSQEYGFYQFQSSYQNLFYAVVEFNLTNTKENNSIISSTMPPGFNVQVDVGVTIQTFGSQLNYMTLAFVEFSTQCSKVVNTSTCVNCNQLNNLCAKCLDQFKVAPQCQVCGPGSGLLNQSSNTCGRCNAHCITCKTIDECTQCKEQFQYIPSCQSCVILTNYDDRDPVNPRCWPCPKNCYTCFDNDTCLTCPNEPQVVLGEDNQCRQCGQLGYYYVGGECKSCDPECFSCADSADNCLVCKAGRSISAGCLCDDGYYFSNGECYKCHPTCATCTSASMYSCLTCSNKLRRVFQINEQTQTRKCECAPRYYNNYQQQANIEPDFLYQCNPCYAFCYRCSGPAPNQCTSCLDNDKRFFFKGECNCTDGYFNNPVQQCQPCYDSCRQCLDENKDKCTSCYMQPSDSTLYSQEASKYLYTKNDIYGECLKICPGPRYWGEPTLATCRHQVCGSRYNPSTRQCCYIPTDECISPYEWNPIKDQKNNSRIYLDFTGEMAIKSSLKDLLYNGMNFQILNLKENVDYKVRIYSDDFKLLRPNVEPYCPEETLKNYTHLAKLFIVEIAYSNPIIGADVNLKLETQSVQDPYGVMVKLPKDKRGGIRLSMGIYQPDSNQIYDRAQYYKGILEVISYISAWLILSQIFLFKSYALDIILDLFQETYFIGFLSINLPLSASIILQGLKPFFFQFNLFPVKEHRGNFWFEPFGYKVAITQLYGQQSNALQNMDQPINYFVNMGLDLMIIIIVQTSRGFINSWLRDESFKGRVKSFFEHLQAYIYIFMAKFFYIKFNYLFMASLLVLGQYNQPNGDNINEIYIGFVMLTYTMIVVSRYIHNINDPSRGLKCQPQLKQFFYPFNELLWIQSPFQNNIYSVAMIRKLFISLSIFMLPNNSQAYSQLGLVITIYCLEMAYFFGVWWQSKKNKYESKNYQPVRFLIIQVILTIVKLMNYIMMISIVKMDQEIQDSADKKQFVSQSKVDQKSEQSYNMILGIVLVNFTVGFTAYLMWNLLDESLFKKVQSNIGETIFQSKTQLYHDHQELKLILKDFRAAVQANKQILQFKNFFDQSYEILPLFSVQKMLQSKSKSVKFDTINFRRKNLEFYSSSYEIIDVFKYKDFIVIINNLESQESGAHNFNYDSNPMTVWIYHPAYQVSYVSEETCPKFLQKKFRYLPEDRQPQLNDDILNFATQGQIEYAYHSSYKIESCEVQVGTNVPEMLFRTLFDHESIFFKENLNPFDECTCEQCYYLKEWTHQEKVKRMAIRRSQIEPLRPWNKYDQFETQMVDVSRLTKVIKQSDTKTKVLLSWLSYENTRLSSKVTKVMEDVSNLRKNYESESSDTDDQLKELFGKLIQPDGKVNENEVDKFFEEDDHIPLLNPKFQSNLFVLRLKVLQFK